MTFETKNANFLGIIRLENIYVLYYYEKYELTPGYAELFTGGEASRDLARIPETKEHPGQVTRPMNFEIFTVERF